MPSGHCAPRPAKRVSGAFLVAALALAAAACAGRPAASVQFSPPPRVPPSVVAQPPPTILSAHYAADDAPSLGGLDGIAVVFSEDIDAAGLRPGVFLVLLADGGRTLAKEAVLAPASEADENRTVWLLGDFGDPRRRPPTDVVVIAPLHTESGSSLEGVLAPVLGFDEGGRISYAQAQQQPCASGGLRVRTFWTDALRDVAQEDLQAISMELVSGRTVSPSGFEDHAEAGAFIGESRDDNVLDLCVSSGERVIGVRVQAGAFTDVPGHRSAATRATVARPPDVE